MGILRPVCMNIPLGREENENAVKNWGHPEKGFCDSRLSDPLCIPYLCMERQTTFTPPAWAGKDGILQNEGMYIPYAE